jgi:uncharacterized membrane protein
MKNRRQSQDLKTRFTASLRNNVIAGVLVLVPIGAVVWIVLWLWDLMVRVAKYLPSGPVPKPFLFGLIIGIIWAVGLVSRNYFGERVLGMLAHLLARVPVLSTVYSTLEKLLRAFASGGAKNFSRVVQIEYPRKGLYTLAFVTGERGRQLTIYVPTTPNPTSGFYLFVDADEVKNVDLSVEDALKEIISMGIVHG